MTTTPKSKITSKIEDEPKETTRKRQQFQIKDNPKSKTQQ